MARGIRTCRAVRIRQILPATCLYFAFAAEAAAADRAWWCVTTPNFEVLTDAGETLGRKAAERMEQVRAVLAAAPPFAPRRILVIPETSEYARVRPQTVQNADAVGEPVIALGDQVAGNDSDLGSKLVCHRTTRRSSRSCTSQPPGLAPGARPATPRASGHIACPHSCNP